jgi:serine/threonine protein kinase
VRLYLPESPPGYELIRRLGTGGMGTVYLAHERAAERTVAIKFLNSPSNPASFERFLVEARALARLNHPNIIKVITVETNWREPFLTMEYADGGTLADLTEAHRLPSPGDAARLMLAATEAVAAAHAAGILHRDIKPSNILLQSNAATAETSVSSLVAHPSSLQPKVSDFGLAKRTDRDDGLTLTARPLGTPRYMSPEAAAGRYSEIGPPADVYGLGATFYHLLTGQPPFHGETPDEIVGRVIHHVPMRPRALRPDLSAELEAVVVKAMEKDPAARYPTAGALADDLRRFLAGKAPAAPLLSPWRRTRQWVNRNWKWMAAGVGSIVFAVALVVVGILIDPDPLTPEQQIRKEIAAGETVPLLSPQGGPRSADWPFGSVKSVASTDDGGTCTFESRGACVMLLLSDPGVDSYRIEAEILQMDKFSRVFPEIDNPIFNDVGLVLAYAGQDGPNGTRIHSMMLLGFVEPDADDRPGDKRELALMDIWRVTGGAAFVAPEPGQSLRSVRPVPLAPSKTGKPEWRKLVAEVTPAEIRVPARKGLQSTSAAAIAERRQILQAQLATSLKVPIAPLPDWSPRMPVGIWCRGSKVSVRNVTIEALK